ncbi:MAG: GTP-binding protein [Bacillota bacterium]|nr:GTP-binding protein [Bacillota bacterium]
MKMEIPVYLFTGFLESGKTKFIQETLEDPRFKTGEKTLLIMCEEGETQYDPSCFSEKNVVMETIDDESEVTPQKLAAFEMKYNPSRVLIEYNGMWMLDGLVQAMPEDWLIYQEITFADARTYNTYNANMRSLVVDKLNGCELVVFNRWSPDIKQDDLHKIVRGISRRTDIIYEDIKGNVQYDEIQDPLPFDINAPVIEIADRDYAIWYRDFSEDMQKYVGKTVKFKGLAGTKGGIPSNSFVVGRHVMTCCVDDVAFKGLVCVCDKPHNLKNRTWITVTAKISMGEHVAYKGKGPILNFISMEPAEKPDQEVATFY